MLNKSVTYLMLLEPDVMIVFKKLRCKRSNGFEALDVDADEHEHPVQHNEEKTLKSDLKRKTEHDEINVSIEQHGIIDDKTMIPKKRSRR